MPTVDRNTFFMGSQLSSTAQKMFEDHARARERERRHQGTISLEKALELLYAWADEILGRSKGEQRMTDQGTLEAKQSVMRERHNESRPGRVPKQRQPPAIDMGKYRRRVAAHLLLERGLSLSQVAIKLRVRYAALVEWDRKKRPLL